MILTSSLVKVIVFWPAFDLIKGFTGISHISHKPVIIWVGLIWGSNPYNYKLDSETLWNK